MPELTLAPQDTDITLQQLHLDPYPIYRRLRAEAPVMRVKAAGRTFLTKASDTKFVKDTPGIFSSNDPNTPMKRAFRAHTLMRKDGGDHMAERMAMAPALMPKTIQDVWVPLYRQFAADYFDRLPKGEMVDLHKEISGPLSARILAHILGIPEASDEQMMFWSQALIDGAGNFGWLPGPFEVSDRANDEMDAVLERAVERVKAIPDHSALSVMVHAENPIAMSQIVANIKIAIGGGINEPRDAFSTIVFGLLTEPEQLEEVKRTGKWGAAFEEGVRWVAPIQASSRLVLEDVEIRGCLIPKGDTVMTIQASANHDEEIYDDPERYQVFRSKNPHQAFGSGPHHCGGTHVARRTVGAILTEMLFERFPNISLPDPDVVKWRGFGFRGPINLPVRLG
ncbi:cytochrome P450 [Rhizobium sp. SSA_523]|uniref:cytochrome P450 n=1 Tax=Rhizobium sp. SSA_523 TaxID=2952477 RepID=UPI0020917BD2|nr:cytochrome P450 [Rhizobium sp. SSA_523]MCO5733432.1 cytochrome P450 [Rhizobium sp. SSA_523]WKC21596.1 cytochrome P450 [Rhizobium sp. SSA_523]